jgi:transposase, IS5 family
MMQRRPIRVDDATVFVDKGYVSDERKQATQARGAIWAVKDKGNPGRVLSASQKRRNKKYGVVRARVEHVFRMIKC